MFTQKTRNTAQLERYKQLAPAGFQHYAATFVVRHYHLEVLEGAAIEDILILEFLSYDEAQAWYHIPEYQSASEHRFQGGD